MAQTVLHTAASRGVADHGWLKSHHTFSFSSYFNPERVQFGALRVLNDDEVAGGRGFGEHPHDNMEIISIALEGTLQHNDSMGNSANIETGEIQVMSAGTGIYHTEYNKNAAEPVKFLQIWVFPNKRNVEPRYDQVKIESPAQPNQLVQILSPNPEDAGVWIYQDAWFNLGKLEKGSTVDYAIHQKNNGAYIFVIAGKVEVNGQLLDTRDGYGIWDTDGFTITADADAEVLIMDVPMNL
ncbi:pirin family protein [Pedobacter sp. MC2016-15]|uniref:pirin family protein n=1 Tax=Pedobacter sp. MC2016-15 TaxID=2994473 RepID=UPI0022473AE3|nr:pirin family protein [Pedobacter sp. MC2016-15]MCX2477484.1 pirin family protein [Pedobacter sp. MC2016-15]